MDYFIAKGFVELTSDLEKNRHIYTFQVFNEAWEMKVKILSELFEQ